MKFMRSLFRKNGKAEVPASGEEGELVRHLHDKAIHYLTNYEPPGGRPMTKEEAEEYMSRPFCGDDNAKSFRATSITDLHVEVGQPEGVEAFINGKPAQATANKELRR